MCKVWWEGTGGKRRGEPEGQTHLGLPPAQLRTEFTESAICLPTLGAGGRTKVGYSCRRNLGQTLWSLFCLCLARLLCSSELLLVPPILTLPIHQFIKVKSRDHLHRHYLGRGQKCLVLSSHLLTLGWDPSICMCTITSAWYSRV